MKIVVTLLFLVVGTITASTAQDKYLPDAAHTHVGFSVDHFGVNKVRGSFPDISGELIHSSKPEDIQVTISINTASINTGNANRDTDLRSPNFFDVEKYPTIKFVSRKVSKKDNQLSMTGDLTMRGVTKEVTIPFKMSEPFKDPLPRGQKRLIVGGSLKIDRRDYGLTWSRVMETGELFVSNEVGISIDCEFYLPK